MNKRTRQKNCNMCKSGKPNIQLSRVKSHKYLLVREHNILKHLTFEILFLKFFVEGFNSLLYLYKESALKKKILILLKLNVCTNLYITLLIYILKKENLTMKKFSSTNQFYEFSFFFKKKENIKWTGFYHIKFF